MIYIMIINGTLTYRNEAEKARDCKIMQKERKIKLIDGY